MSNKEVIDITEKLSDWFDRRVRLAQEHFEEYDLDKAVVAHRISLSIILVIAFIVRLFPLIKGWDPTIKAFDPWMQLRAAEYISDNGIWSFLLWHDELSWYPYGRNMGTSMYLGIPIAIVLVYNVLNFIGFNVSIQFAAYLVPVIFGVITVYYTYLLGTELISKRGGLFAAIIMSVTPSFVSRSIGGFVDNEAIGVLFTVSTLYYFARAYLRDSNRNAIYAGISMFLLAGSWGAFRFTYDLLPIVALVFVISGKFTFRFLRAYVTTLSVSTLLMILIPRVGGKFMGTTEGIAPIGFIAFLVLFGILQNLSQKLSPESFRRMIVLGFIFIAAILGGLFIILITTGVVAGVGDKFISVIIPTTRNEIPLIDSVSEHLPLAWGNLYENLSTLVFFLPVGVYYAMKNPTEKNLFVLAFGLTTIYFSGSMVRLMLILAPSAAILSALAIDNLLLPYAYAAHGRIKLTKITMSLPSIGGQNAAISYVMVFSLLTIMLTNGVDTAGNRFSTPELTPGQSPNQALTDWLQAFKWMRDNTAFYQYTPENNFRGLETGQPPVMLSWWDYGYYITGQGDTITLVDNATSNSTQIGVVGTMLMWNASASINLMWMYNIKHVMVVPSGGQLGLGSDIGKSIWMIRISEDNVPIFGVEESDYYDETTGQYQDKYYDSVLWQLMAYHNPDMGSDPGAGRPPFCTVSEAGCSNQLSQLVPEARTPDVGEVNELEYFTEVFRTTGINPSLSGLYPLVRIYEVNYPDDIELRVNDFKLKLAQMQAAAAA